MAQNSDIRWKQRFENFEKAFDLPPDTIARLRAVIEELPTPFF